MDGHRKNFITNLYEKIFAGPGSQSRELQNCRLNTLQTALIKPNFLSPQYTYVCSQLCVELLSKSAIFIVYFSKFAACEIDIAYKIRVLYTINWEDDKC